MNRSISTAILMVALCLGLIQIHTASAIKPHVYEPVAVVELSTSEGCSSCPPADRLLTQLATEARTDESRVLALAFHVDYWNHLGWKGSVQPEAVL